MAPRTKPTPDSGTTISNCTFDATIKVDADFVNAVVALAKAAEHNAEAIRTIASNLQFKGNHAPAILINPQGKV
jgi:mannitol/fructose-specific phosphotransferase system IIA component